MNPGTGKLARFEISGHVGDEGGGGWKESRATRNRVRWLLSYNVRVAGDPKDQFSLLL